VRARVIERATGAAVGEIEAETSYGLWTALLDWAERRGTPRFRALAYYRTEREPDASGELPTAPPAPRPSDKTRPAARTTKSPRPSPSSPDDEADMNPPAPAGRPLTGTPPDGRRNGATVGQPSEALSPLPAPPTPPDETPTATTPTGAQPWLMPPDPNPTGDAAEAVTPSRPARRRRSRRPAAPEDASAAEQLRLF
jgi:hypothetical protein